MKRVFTNILSSNVDAAASFYQALLGMSRHFNSDWFVVLTHEDCPTLEFGILDRENAIVPSGLGKAPQGVIVTFVVEDVEIVFAKAQSLGAAIIEPPTDLFYGQRRLLIEDLDGTVVDISSPTAQIGSR